MRLSGLGGSFVNDFCCGARAGGEGQDSAEGLPHVPSILNVGSLHDLSWVSGHSWFLRLLLVFLRPPPSPKHFSPGSLEVCWARVAQAYHKVGLEIAFFAIRLVCIVDLNIQDIDTE